jgi:transmembrane sensor
VQNSAQIEECAADWLAKRESGSWSASDDAQLSEWLRASTAHRVALLRLEAAWQQANRLRALGTQQRGGLHLRTAPQPRIRRSHRMAPLAASVLLAIALGVVGPLCIPVGSSFRTAVGAVAAVPMPDGSKVTLNTDSQIRIALTESERRVNLGRGEAFFEVAHDPSRPFVVVAGDCKVVAVGTKFSVWREANEVRVAVVEGRVRVEGNDSGVREEAAAEIVAGSVAHAGDAGVLVQHKPLGEVEEELSWRRGFLVFRGVPLTEAVAEFNRYNREKIIIGSPAIADIRIGGNFRSTNAAGFVRLLKDGFAIHVDRHGDRIILTGG